VIVRLIPMPFRIGENPDVEMPALPRRGDFLELWEPGLRGRFFRVAKVVHRVDLVEGQTKVEVYLRSRGPIMWLLEKLAAFS